MEIAASNGRKKKGAKKKGARPRVFNYGAAGERRRRHPRIILDERWRA
jgi:hypothetical protein